MSSSTSTRWWSASLVYATSCSPTSSPADRAARLAEVFELEARAWSQLYELSTLRLVWRAALAAEAGARVERSAVGRARGAGEAGRAPADGGPRRLLCGRAPLDSPGRPVVGDAERRCVDLVRDSRVGDLREGAGGGWGGRVRADRAGVVRVDAGGAGVAGGGVGVRLVGGWGGDACADRSRACPCAGCRGRLRPVG